MKNQLVVYSLVGLLFLSIFYAFWRQEWKYILPTPVPKDYVTVSLNTTLHLQGLPIARILQARKTPKPIFLHFFSPDCPCSAYNIAHFKHLVKAYSPHVDFYAVLFSDDDTYQAQDFKRIYGVDIPVIQEKGIDIAIACGVYATPQAVIIDKNLLFYRGNYNKSRYCTDKNTNFAEIALQSLLAGKPLPDFGKGATTAYGCELPENTNTAP
jgi:hypothetical protein